MESTDWILLLIAMLIAAGISVSVWNIRRRERETEMMKSALYAIATKGGYFRAHEPVPVTFDPSVNKAITRFSRTAIDMQGMIELTARWMVSQMPPEVLDGMETPEDWVTAEKISRQGVTKKGGTK